METLWQGTWRSAEADTSGFRSCNALGLPLTDVSALILRYEGQHLQHDIAQKGSHQVFATSGIQKRHIQHHDINPLVLSQNPPLLQDLSVIAPQAVNALDIEQIVLLESTQHLFILRSLEVLAGLLIHENVLLWNLKLPQRNHLPVLILISAADPDISIYVSHLSPFRCLFQHKNKAPPYCDAYVCENRPPRWQTVLNLILNCTRYACHLTRR